MRCICGFGFVFVLLTLPAAAARAASEEWRAAAKDVVNFTADRVEDRVKEDPEALSALKDVKSQSMTAQWLDQVAGKLKKELNTEAPDEDALAKMKKRIGGQIDKCGVKDVKDMLKGVTKPQDLPCWILFPGCP